MLAEQRKFECNDCNHKWGMLYGTGRIAKCPECGSTNVHRSADDVRGRGVSGARRHKRLCSGERTGKSRNT